VCRIGSTDASILYACVDSAMHEAVAAIAACGVSPLVRIAANEGWMVKRRTSLAFRVARLAYRLFYSRRPGFRW